MIPPADKQHIYNLIEEPTEAVVVGEMMQMANFNGQTSQSLLQASLLRVKNKKEFTRTKGKVIIRLKGRWPNHCRPGDKLIIRGNFKRPESYRSPGAFDYARFLAQKNIWISGYIKTPIFIEKLSSSSTLFDKLRALPERIRSQIGMAIDKSLSDQQAAVYRALLIGDRSSLSPATLEWFKASGTMHILAISGIHITIVGSLIYLSIFWILSRSEKFLLHFHAHKITATATIPFLVTYALLTGMNSPVTRAVLMSCIIIAAILTNRTKSPSTLIALAALLILLFDPLQLFTVSFQLSFCAVSGILLTLPTLSKILQAENHTPTRNQISRRVILWISAMILVSTVAFLVTAPITLSEFNRITPIGILTNLLIEPLLCLWALPFGLLSILSNGFSNYLADVFLQIGAIGIDLTLLIVKYISSVPYGSIRLPTPPQWLVILYYLCLIFFFTKKNLHPKSTLWGAVPALVCFILLLSPPLPAISIVSFPLFKSRDSIRTTNQPQITFLDVGQGSATLIKSKTGIITIIDSGGSSYSQTTIGERVVGPYLWNKGISKIDNLIITHPDADHYNGLPFLIEHFNPTTIWIRAFEEDDEMYKKLLLEATRNKAKIKIAKAGQIISLDGNTVECLYNFSTPNSSILHTNSRAKENSGLIIKVCLSGQCCLFPGDIDSTGEQHLIDNDINLSSTILLAAHHGSKSSNSATFLDEVDPDYLIVSAGRNRSGNFPHNSLLQKAAVKKIRLLKTADYGSIEMTVNETGEKSFFHYTRFNNNPLYPQKKTRLE